MGMTFQDLYSLYSHMPMTASSQVLFNVVVGDRPRCRRFRSWRSRLKRLAGVQTLTIRQPLLPPFMWRIKDGNARTPMMIITICGHFAIYGVQYIVSHWANVEVLLPLCGACNPLPQLVASVALIPEA